MQIKTRDKCPLLLKEGAQLPFTIAGGVIIIIIIISLFI